MKSEEFRATPAVFIGGMPRSGTTLLSMLLNGHSEIAIAPETHYFRKYYRKGNRRQCLSSSDHFDRFAQFFLSGPELKSFGVTDEDRKDLLQLITSGTERSHGLVLGTALRHYATKCGKQIWGDKTPSNALFIDEILGVFPNARVIGIVRDPRDVVLSLSKISWHRGNLVQHAREWRDAAGVIRTAAIRHPTNVLCVKYEDVLDDPERVLSSICAFLGVTFESSMIEYHQHAIPNFSVVDEPWKAKNLLPLDARNKMKWKNALSDNECAIIEKIIGPEMESFGYDRVIDRTTPSAYFTHWYMYFENLVYMAQYWMKSAWLRLSGSY